MIYVNVLDEAGYDCALRGLAFNKKRVGADMKGVAEKLAHMDGGHNKFLQQIYMWAEIQAPLFWWRQFDTYKVGITAQSESTMHTLRKELINVKDEAEYIEKAFYHGLHGCSKNTLLHMIALASMAESAEDEEELACVLPNSYLQTRLVTLNYKNLRNIILQRQKHKLGAWQQIVGALYIQAEHKSLLPEPCFLKKGI